MGYTIKQKIEICLQSDANPLMTQIDLANWAMRKYGSSSPPSQTTISRILSSKNEILGSKESDFLLVRRRKVSNALLRLVLTEWMTQAHWERIPVTTPIIQLTANAIWNKLSSKDKDGNGSFSHKWCNHFVRKLNVNLVGSPDAIEANMGYPLNKVWGLDEKVGLKIYIHALISKHNYLPRDLFTIDEFLLFYCVPLDQIFDVSSVDKGLSQTSNFTDYIITIMLGCNMDGSEKLNPLVVSKHDTFDLSESTLSTFHGNSTYSQLPSHTLANKVSEAYQITYKYNNNKWITSSTFQDYLLTLDHKLESVSPGRNIVIFLDDSSTHRLMNLEFKHIRLVYLENASKHNNPYNGLFNQVKFDYIPTSFGIVEEFKIVFRLQQYLEMINKQNNQVAGDHSLSPISRSDQVSKRTNDPGEILSEKDYQVPFIKAIEWIKRSWDSISKQKIYQSWKKANIIDTAVAWPASNPAVQSEATNSLRPLIESAGTYDPHLAYNKLKNVMGYLNVVIPWEINELLGLVNERTKVSLNYASIDEMINSCALSVKGSEVVEEKVESAISDPVEKNSLDSPIVTWPSPGPIPLGESTFPNSASLTPQPAGRNITRSYTQGPPQLFLSFQDKLPPITVAPPARQRGTSLARIGSNGYSLSENRSSSMDALLLATTSATNYVDSQPSANGGNSPSYGTDFLPNTLKNDLVYDVPIMNTEIQSTEQARKRHRLSSSITLESPSSNPGAEDLALYTKNTAPAENFRYPYSILNPGGSTEAKLPENPEALIDEELVSLLRKVIDATNNKGIRLSDLALDELKFNLSRIQSKQGLKPWSGQES